MASCFGKAMKVPHITNRAPQGRAAIFRFFIRAFILGYNLVSWATLITGILIRVLLGLPDSCVDLTDSVYAATYTLIAVSILALGCLLLTYVRAKHFKNSKDIKMYLILFGLVVTAEIFVAIMAVFQSSRMKCIVTDNIHHFAVNECLEDIQSEHSCCGFNTFDEWLTSIKNSSDPDATGSQVTSLFPASCHCQPHNNDNCVNITYSLSSRNNTNTDSSTQGPSSHTVNTNYKNDSFKEFITDSIHSNSCHTSIVNILRNIQVASGVTSLVACVFQLVILVLQIYLLHNLEGAGTVSDSSCPPIINVDVRSHRGNRAVSIVDINVHFQSRHPDWSSESRPQDESVADCVSDSAVEKGDREMKLMSLFQANEVQSSKPTS